MEQKNKSKEKKLNKIKHMYTKNLQKKKTTWPKSNIMGLRHEVGIQVKTGR